jgi:2-polyprenyl-3-methyl-5-hydroxy-6-metoxy-1,4-benzoquinol methylase
LELGCHTGNLSRWLRQQECEVTGVELNGVALGHARKFLADAYNADLEDKSLWSALRSRQFDVVLALHVLEHLSDPWSILERINSVLTKQGELIVGLPNICSATARFEILFGRFKYEKTGVLDRTHLRFFDQMSARELIHSGGFEVCEYFGPEGETDRHPHIKIPFLWRLAPLAARLRIPGSGSH